MAKIRYEHNYKNTGKLLKSKELENLLAAIARDAQMRAGEAYRWDTWYGDSRVISSVYTYDADAIQDNYDHNTLLKVLCATRVKK